MLLPLGSWRQCLDPGGTYDISLVLVFSPLQWTELEIGVYFPLCPCLLAANPRAWRFQPGQSCRPTHKTIIPWRFQPLLHSPSEALASGSQEFFSPPSGTSLHSTSDTLPSATDYSLVHAVLTISCLPTVSQLFSSLYLSKMGTFLLLRVILCSSHSDLSINAPLKVHQVLFPLSFLEKWSDL